MGGRHVGAGAGAGAEKVLYCMYIRLVGWFEGPLSYGWVDGWMDE